MSSAKLFQSCPTLCDPIDGSPPGSPDPGILQAKVLEWVAISFSNKWKWKVKGKSLTRVQLLATPWTAAYQAPPSMGFSRQEYWSGVPLLSPRVYSNSSPLSQWCYPTISSSVIPFSSCLFPNISIFSNASALLIRWPKYWSFSIRISPSNEYSGLISFRRKKWMG